MAAVTIIKDTFEWRGAAFSGSHATIEARRNRGSKTPVGMKTVPRTVLGINLRPQLLRYPTTGIKYCGPVCESRENTEYGCGRVKCTPLSCPSMHPIPVPAACHSHRSQQKYVLCGNTLRPLYWLLHAVCRFTSCSELPCWQHHPRRARFLRPEHVCN